MEDEDWKSESHGFRTCKTELKELDGLTSGVGLSYKHKSDVWYQAYAS